MGERPQVLSWTLYILKKSEKLCKNTRTFGIHDQLHVVREEWCLRKTVIQISDLLCGGGGGGQRCPRF